jgi:galactose mutarotase-like enzyme
MAAPRETTFLGQRAVQWQVGASSFLALPELGARLLRWSLADGTGGAREVLHWPDQPEAEIPFVRGGNPILFPFCARCFLEGTIFRWRDPAGVVRPMPLHGFARQSRFAVRSIWDRGFSACLQPDVAARQAYPYDYDFEVRYEFAPSGLTTHLTLTNRGTVAIPWSAGHHFYITVPWRPGGARAEYRIEIPATFRLRQSAVGALVPGPQLNRRESLAHPELSSTFHGGLESAPVMLVDEVTGSGLEMSMDGRQLSLRECVLTTWTQDDDVPYYCLEPWMGPPNSPETGVGLHWVPPGQQQTFGVKIALV